MTNIRTGGVMPRIVYYIFILLMLSQPAVINARAEEEKDAYDTQVPPGMELQQVGNKPSYRVVLPKGTALRREGDLRIVEGTGEYASRKFVDYDEQLEKMGADIESLKKDVEDIKKSIADMQRAALTSKER
jgi:hypothetical protein